MKNFDKVHVAIDMMRPDKRSASESYLVDWWKSQFEDIFLPLSRRVLVPSPLIFRHRRTSGRRRLTVAGIRGGHLANARSHLHPRNLTVVPAISLSATGFSSAHYAFGLLILDVIANFNGPGRAKMRDFALTHIENWMADRFIVERGDVCRPPFCYLVGFLSSACLRADVTGLLMIANFPVANLVCR